MSEHVANYFPRQLNVVDAPAVAERTRSWLVAEGLILPDCWGELVPNVVQQLETVSQLTLDHNLSKH